MKNFQGFEDRSKQSCGSSRAVYLSIVKQAYRKSMSTGRWPEAYNVCFTIIISSEPLILLKHLLMSIAVGSPSQTPSQVLWEDKMACAEAVCRAGSCSSALPRDLYTTDVLSVILRLQHFSRPLQGGIKLKTERS